MWETLRNVWRVPELRKKVLYTFFMLLIFRLVSVIPVPGLDPAVMQQAAETYDMLGLMNMMTGSSLSQMTIMAMGISPYINASIIMQLLTIAIPALERLQKEGGEEGKKKVQQITRYVTIALAALQAIGIVAGLGAIKPGYANFFGYVAIGIILAGGTALAMWIGEQITKNGIGNGISLLIFAGIISNLFSGFSTLIANSFTATSLTPWIQFLAVLAMFLVIIVLVTFVDMGVRRINVNYAKRVTGRRMYGGQNTVIPMKVVSVGVLPLIFAYSFMAFPGTIIQLIGGASSGAAIWWSQYMNAYSPLYMIITALLIVAFTYFYSSISFQPDEMAKNIQQQGGAIPSVRPGKPTADYLRKVNNRLILFAALFLAVLATVPTLLTLLLGIQLPFAASSLLIAVSVVLEFKRQMDDLLVSRNYDSIS